MKKTPPEFTFIVAAILLAGVSLVVCVELIKADKAWLVLLFVPLVIGSIGLWAGQIYHWTAYSRPKVTSSTPS